MINYKHADCVYPYGHTQPTEWRRLPYILRKSSISVRLAIFALRTKTLPHYYRHKYSASLLRQHNATVPGINSHCIRWCSCCVQQSHGFAAHQENDKSHVQPAIMSPTSSDAVNYYYYLFFRINIGKEGILTWILGNLFPCCILEFLSMTN